MIKTLSICLAALMLCYIAWIGHYYYQTFSTFSSTEQSQSVDVAP